MTILEQAQTTSIKKPNARFMFSHPAHLIAQGLGSGLSPVMPGTSGTLFAWLTFNVMNTRWPDWLTAPHWAIVIAVAFVVGTWACDKTGRDLGVADHGSMVIDEIVAFWIVLLLIAPAGFGAQFWAFICFRFFDMVKPPPIGYFDRRFKNGFGVMWDDIVAAFFTLLLLALWRL